MAAAKRKRIITKPNLAKQRDRDSKLNDLSQKKKKTEAALEDIKERKRKREAQKAELNKKKENASEEEASKIEEQLRDIEMQLENDKTDEVKAETEINTFQQEIDNVNTMDIDDKEEVEEEEVEDKDTSPTGDQRMKILGSLLTGSAEIGPGAKRESPEVKLKAHQSVVGYKNGRGGNPEAFVVDLEHGYFNLNPKAGEHVRGGCPTGRIRSDVKVPQNNDGRAIVFNAGESRRAGRRNSRNGQIYKWQDVADILVVFIRPPNTYRGNPENLVRPAPTLSKEKKEELKKEGIKPPRTVEVQVFLLWHEKMKVRMDTGEEVSTNLSIETRQGFRAIFGKNSDLYLYEIAKECEAGYRKESGIDLTTESIPDDIWESGTEWWNDKGYLSSRGGPIIKEEPGIESTNAKGAAYDAAYDSQFHGWARRNNKTRDSMTDDDWAKYDRYFEKYWVAGKTGTV